MFHSLSKLDLGYKEVYDLTCCFPRLTTGFSQPETPYYSTDLLQTDDNCVSIFCLLVQCVLLPPSSRRAASFSLSGWGRRGWVVFYSLVNRFRRTSWDGEIWTGGKRGFSSCLTNWFSQGWLVGLGNETSCPIYWPEGNNWPFSFLSVD